MRLPAPAGPALLEQPGGRLVQKEDYVGMRAQDAGLRPGVDVAVNGIADGFGLIGAGGQQQDAPCVHNAADSQADGLAGHIVFAFKEAAVGLNGALGEVDDMAAVDEGIGGFVEADMAVAPDAQHLNGRSPPAWLMAVS